MSSTGDALEALFDALAAAATVTVENPTPAIPAPLQNEALPSRLVEIQAGSGIEMHLCIWDDSDGEPEETLGADVIEGGYEHTREVPVELIVSGGERAARRAAFEAALEAIDDAIAADRTLGGKVDDARMLAPRRNGSGLATDGLPLLLAADIRVRLTYTSSRSF